MPDCRRNRRCGDVASRWRNAAAPTWQQRYLVGEGAVQVAGDGGDDVALGHSVVAGVGEALAARNATTAALALIGLSDAGPHRHGAAALWEIRGVKGWGGVEERLFIIRLSSFFCGYKKKKINLQVRFENCVALKKTYRTHTLAAKLGSLSR